MAEREPSLAVIVAGPTASGKSALALALAMQFDGVVINADSMQIYRELRILTARPNPEDEARLFDANHRNKLMGAVLRAIDSYFAAKKDS